MESYNTETYGFRTDTRDGAVTSSYFIVDEVEALNVLADGKSGDKKTPTSHRFTKYQEKHPFGETFYYDDWGSGRLYGTHGCHSNSYSNSLDDYPGNYGWSDANSDAISQLYRKIKESPINLSVDAFEGRETMRMFRNAYNAVRGIKRFARRAFNDMKRDPSLSASNAWLQYQYGWKPLMGTIHGALMFHHEHWDFFKVRARGKASHSFSSRIYNGRFAYGAHHDLVGSASYRDQYEIYYAVTDREAFTRDRVMSMDPLAIAWELVPYSFVVDWFYDIGGYMDELQIAHNVNLKFYSGYRTRTKIETQSDIYHGKFYSGQKYREYSLVGSKTWKEKDRSILLEFPEPIAPRVTYDLGVWQYISAAALLRQLL